ncbi:MAG TPA: 2-phospho-L-lactate transferase [Solirubrobacterales bacterium]|nr:2-phospho-L-lactate transferase [Solirubrobacterales bacterium]
MKTVLLAGGTGGGKLAAGLQEALGSELAVIANTADDTELHGLYVSVDPDLVTFWLAGVIDEERGWGFRDDAFVVHEHLQQLGAPGWFGLSDRDLATSLYRTHFIAEGGTLTGAQAQIARSLGASARVLPMCEERVETRIRTAAGWRGLQEFMILDHGEGEIAEVRLDGIESARPTAEVLQAIGEAEVIVIGPSNPVISIGPILAVPGIREAIAAAAAPVVGVSPLVGGRSLKGPTESFLRALGRPLSAAGVASLYAGLLDGMVADPDDPGPEPEGVRLLTRPTLMKSEADRRRVAADVLAFAAELR